MMRWIGRWGGLLLLAVLAAVRGGEGASAREIAEMSAEEIRLLQSRLTQAGCYAGPQDGKPGQALADAKAACPDQEPRLRIETGMHVAKIWRIAADAQCRLIATGAEDKTVRLWSPQGRLLRTQRLPIGPGNGGKVFAVAVSPDGTLVAAGGWDATYDSTQNMGVYLFEAGQGEAVRRLGAFESVINHLAFSPDGTRLAVALGAGHGVRVLDVGSGREVMADRDFGGKSSNGLAFGPDGALVAVGLDGFLRRYAPDLVRFAKMAARGGKKPSSVAVDPAGRRLAVGYADSTAVDLYDPVSLSPLGAANTAGVDNGNLGRVEWSRDGRRLVAGGRYAVRQDGRWPSPLLTWTPEGRRLGAPVPVADTTVMSLEPCGEAVAFGAADPAFGLLGPDGRARSLGQTRTADMRDKRGGAFTVSPDGTRLRLGLGYSAADPVLFDLGRATLTEAPGPSPELRPAATKGLAVTDWEDDPAPKLAGKALALDANEGSRALAVRADRTGFVLGAEFSLRAFDAAGRQAWRADVPGVAWGVTLARGGDLVLAAYGDGTIRWHRGRDGQELLALFIDRPSRRWVAWTPSGYYTASAGGEDLIGWHVNRGWAQQADFFAASQFRARFNRPDIVQAVLDTLDEGEAIRRADRNRPVETTPIGAALPPVLTLVSPTSGSRFSGESVEVVYELRSPSGLRVDRVDVLIDGSPLGLRGLAPDDFADGRRQRMRVTLPRRDVELGLIAHAGSLSSEVVRAKLAYAASGPDPADLLKRKLYALVVGVGEYANPGVRRLAYPPRDATEFAKVLLAQKGGLYGDVQVRVLTDRAATAQRVKEELYWLNAEMTDRDIAVVFLAGHGLTDARNTFWFLTHEADVKRPLISAVSRDDIMRVLEATPGKKVMFLDACHSGAMLTAANTRAAPVDMNTVVNDFASAGSGLVVYASSMGTEFSVERPTWQHGAFTKALIEAIGEGKADLLKTGTITTTLLEKYIADRVKELTEGGQHPVMSRPVAVPDFPFAVRR